MPTREMPQPHWKAAVRTPNAAAADSRLVTAACSGISSERNAIISSRKPSRITVPITSSSRSEISVGEVDVRRGVAADVRRDAPVLVGRSGSTSSRTSSTQVGRLVGGRGRRRARRRAGRRRPSSLICGGVRVDDAGGARQPVLQVRPRGGRCRGGHRRPPSPCRSAASWSFSACFCSCSACCCSALSSSACSWSCVALLPAARRPGAAGSAACRLQLVGPRPAGRRPARSSCGLLPLQRVGLRCSRSAWLPGSCAVGLRLEPPGLRRRAGAPRCSSGASWSRTARLPVAHRRPSRACSRATRSGCPAARAMRRFEDPLADLEPGQLARRAAGPRAASASRLARAGRSRSASSRACSASSCRWLGLQSRGLPLQVAPARPGAGRAWRSSGRPAGPRSCVALALERLPAPPRAAPAGSRAASAPWAAASASSRGRSCSDVALSYFLVYSSLGVAAGSSCEATWSGPL